MVELETLVIVRRSKYKKNIEKMLEDCLAPSIKHSGEHLMVLGYFDTGTS